MKIALLTREPKRLTDEIKVQENEKVGILTIGSSLQRENTQYNKTAKPKKRKPP
jgi:hypothetical protein